ncbi:MAG: hypothetical protein WCJ84_00115 [Candidatus Peregrinibacteria bacterium]
MLPDAQPSDEQEILERSGDTQALMKYLRPRLHPATRHYADSIAPLVERLKTVRTKEESGEIIHAFNAYMLPTLQNSSAFQEAQEHFTYRKQPIVAIPVEIRGKISYLQWNLLHFPEGFTTPPHDHPGVASEAAIHGYGEERYYSPTPKKDDHGSVLHEKVGNRIIMPGAIVTVSAEDNSPEVLRHTIEAIYKDLFQSNIYFGKDLECARIPIQ